jgi:CDP-glucose 4,6-dehydratase
LLKLGARVVGVSNDVPTSPAHFECAGLAAHITDLRLDVRDGKALATAIGRAQPDFIFHLAAQPLVRRSYNAPIETLAVNIMGSAHLLDALRNLGKSCSVVMITSDKCYDNVEWTWGYRETDRLGGKDPYSASKGAAELTIRTFVESYFRNGGSIRVAVGRAGNVVGGGDWAADRLVPDCVRAWAQKRAVDIRSPQATRPWQHVLEPLSGYLTLGAELTKRAELNGEPFNFGPQPEQNRSVLELLTEMKRHWPQASHVVVPSNEKPEAGLLKLNCDKAHALLQWRATLDFAETVQMTGEWYRTFYEHPNIRMLNITNAQIDEYTTVARQRGLRWLQESTVSA